MPQVTPSKWLTTAGWEDVPHLDERTMADLLASTQPHLRDSRRFGTPSLGSGAVFPLALSEIEEEPFAIPAHWPRAYGMDVGWNRTAAVWGAWDFDGVLHLYSEHYRGQAEASVHASAIRARGAWIPGVIDCAARGRSEIDGQQLMVQYIDQGLRLVPARKGAGSVDSGLLMMWQMLSENRLRVFKNMQNWKQEFRLYRRDKNGAIVKENDHLMDGTRYLVMYGRQIAKVKGADLGPKMAARGKDPVGGY